MHQRMGEVLVEKTSDEGEDGDEGDDE